MKPQSADEKQTAFGLVANGSAGSWDVALDEALSGPQRWFLQIDGPSCYLYVQIKHPRTIEETLEFLGGRLDSGEAPRSAPSSEPSDELEISRFGGSTVTFVFENEGEPRCYILVAGTNELCTRIGITRSDLDSIVSALGQVRDELFAEGVLARAS